MLHRQKHTCSDWKRYLDISKYFSMSANS